MSSQEGGELSRSNREKIQFKIKINLNENGEINMTKLFRRSIFLVLAVLMIASLAVACGAPAAEAPPEEEQPAAEEEQPAEEEGAAGPAGTEGDP